VKILHMPALWIWNETQIYLRHRFLGKALEISSVSRAHLIPSVTCMAKMLNLTGSYGK
jgi:hypothetical protein